MNEPIVISEASGVVAIRKPPGLATQAPPGIPSVETWLRARLHGGDPRGYVGVPHRLDRAVSGVLLMAATPRAARKLSRQFERREVTKTYLAIVAGGAAEPPPDGAGTTWCDMVEKVVGEARSRIVTADAAGGREAMTRVWRLPASGSTSDELLLRLEPQTGRMHQLRLQGAARGLPIVGDTLYGGRSLSPPSEAGREQPILLHAWRISYADPDTGERLAIEATLPPYWPAWAVSSCAGA
ncbi:MAG: RluA family pseudouridine synthase [Pirellulales bacterium]